MLYYDRTDLSIGISVNKASKSGQDLPPLVLFQLHVCNACRDLLMITINLSDIDILNIKSVDYCCIIS